MRTVDKEVAIKRFLESPDGHRQNIFDRREFQKWHIYVTDVSQEVSLITNIEKADQ